MDIFPLVPAPELIAPLLGSPSVAKAHADFAYSMALGCAIFGTIILWLWAPYHKSAGVHLQRAARQGVTGGALLYAVGVVSLFFGLYAMMLLGAVIVACALYAIVQGARIAFGR